MALLISFLIGVSALPFPQDAFSSDPVPSFTDISATEQLYAPHILKMAESRLVQGKRSDDGMAAFQPERAITRAELSKVTAMVRLAERIDAKGTMDRIRVPQEIEIALKSYYRCGQGICGNIGGKPFSDVAEKADSCADALRMEDLCVDWFTQYAYFAVAKGYAKGYPPAASGGNWSFKPADPVLRIHALKMLMAEDGNTALGNDTRYKRLLALADSEKDGPRCLEPQALNLILEKAGGAKGEGAQKLLAYARLADRLGFFGGTEFKGGCAVFGQAYSPQMRADFLFAPLTRQEAARYAALTSDYVHIKVDRASDMTLRGQMGVYVKEVAPTAPDSTETVDLGMTPAIGMVLADAATTPVSPVPAKPTTPSAPPPCGRAVAPGPVSLWSGGLLRRNLEKGTVLCLAGTLFPETAIGGTPMAVAVREKSAYGIPCAQLEGLNASVTGCSAGRGKTAETPAKVNNFRV